MPARVPKAAAASAAALALAATGVAAGVLAVAPGSEEPAPPPPAQAPPEGPVEPAAPEPRPAPAPRVAAPAPELPPPLARPTIDAWMPDHRGACRHYGARTFCDGPRRVPAPHGPAAALAERLGLGGRQTYDALVGRDPPPPAWVAQVAAPAHDDLLWPVPEGFLGRRFGHTRSKRIAHRPHRGVDIPAAPGSLVRAADGGLVVYADNGVRGFGNLLLLVHADGEVTLYAHCQELFVFEGQQVRRGQVVGTVGETGWARAPHLHFELRRQGIARNPERRFVDRPRGDEAQRLINAQRERTRAAEERMAAKRAKAQRWLARRARREAATRGEE